MEHLNSRSSSRIVSIENPLPIGPKGMEGISPSPPEIPSDTRLLTIPSATDSTIAVTMMATMAPIIPPKLEATAIRLEKNPLYSDYPERVIHVFANEKH